MKNTTNLGLFVAHWIVLEYAERIYAYIDGRKETQKWAYLG